MSNTKKLTPQVQTLLSHLKTHGSITQAEASTVYRMRALPRRISDLKEVGHIIRRELKVDATGQRYARYFYEGFKKPEQKQLDIPTPPAKPKVGDRVRVVSPFLTSGSYAKGDEGKVVRMSADGEDLYVDFDNGNTNVYVFTEEVEVLA